jgi:hypothetical protein
MRERTQSPVRAALLDVVREAVKGKRAQSEGAVCAQPEGPTI